MNQALTANIRKGFGMAAITFDTLKFAKRLKAAGFNETQAEALSDAQRESLAEILDTSLATKSDITRLEKEIASVKAEIIKWVAGMLVAQAAIVATLVKLL